MNKSELKVLNDVLFLLERACRNEKKDFVKEEYINTLMQYRIILSTINKEER